MADGPGVSICEACVIEQKSRTVDGIRTCSFCWLQEKREPSMFAKVKRERPDELSICAACLGVASKIFRHQ